jgi:hypothetical protein
VYVCIESQASLGQIFWRTHELGLTVRQLKRIVGLERLWDHFNGREGVAQRLGHNIGRALHTKNIGYTYIGGYFGNRRDGLAEDRRLNSYAGDLCEEISRFANEHNSTKNCVPASVKECLMHLRSLMEARARCVECAMHFR